MFVLASVLPKIPFGPWVDDGVNWLTKRFLWGNSKWWECRDGHDD